MAVLEVGTYRLTASNEGVIILDKFKKTLQFIAKADITKLCIYTHRYVTLSKTEYLDFDRLNKCDTTIKINEAILLANKAFEFILKHVYNFPDKSTIQDISMMYI